MASFGQASRLLRSYSETVLIQSIRLFEDLTPVYGLDAKLAMKSFILPIFVV
jgi:hypothetical protein